MDYDDTGPSPDDTPLFDGPIDRRIISEVEASALARAFLRSIGARPRDVVTA